MDLYLIRHGRTAWNREEVFRGRADVPLDEVGRREAELLASRLRGSGIDEIYSSPLSRARETAEVIARGVGLEVRIASELVDLDFGLWQGLPVKEVKERFGKLYELWQKAPHKVRFPEGEDLKAVRDRVVGFVEGLLKAKQGKRVALVSHRVVLKVLICSLLGLGLEAFWRVVQGTAALNHFRWRDGFWEVRLLNDTCHLKGLGDEGAVEF